MPKRSKRSSDFQRPLYSLKLRGATLELGRQTKIMGILNVTPDSFSDGGAYVEPALAEERALRMEAEGAHVIDVGGESTRPGARPVGSAEEIGRIRPVLKRLARKIKIPLSIDTMRSETAHIALSEGARIVNDVSGLRNDPDMARTVARHKAALVLMHMKGTPETMQRSPRYSDTIGEIKQTLKGAVARALEAGVAARSIVVDPGFGFGKSVRHNFEILARLRQLSELGFPVLAGLSRKSFIGHVLETGPQGRLYGSLAAAAAAIAGGAHILRVHDVLEHAHLARVLDGVEDAR